jgi:heptosyltransferase-1
MSSPDLSLLIVKTSSLGDVIHTLPVVEDLARHRPEVRIDWMVEEAYADLLRLEPHVRRVVAVAQRRWRAQRSDQSADQRRAFEAELHQVNYDVVIDFQGLLKSALLARKAHLAEHGKRVGYSFSSAREPLARLFYRRGYSIGATQHAVERLRSLAGQAFGYQPSGPPRFNLVVPAIQFDWLTAQPYAVFLHATARAEKQWPDAAFRSLAQHLATLGVGVVVPSGNQAERLRATVIAKDIPSVLVAPPLKLDQIARLLQQAALVVGVDTGLTHLAVALETPTIGLFGATPRWRYAPYWSDKAISLGDRQQPGIEEVIAAADRLQQQKAVDA